jgi:hypothetical protein
MTMAKLNSTLIVSAKLAVAGTVICAIAWGFAVYQPDGTIKESQADILDLNFVELSSAARFGRGLEQLGHDEPQSFSINGNVMHFSVNHTRERPYELMRKYQEEFIHQDLNEKIWDSQTAKGHTDEMMYDAMTGSIVPLIVESEYVAMGGVTPANDARNDTELMGLALSQPETPGDVFKGHKWIEMFWDKYRRKTTVTASWSDENFDYGKAAGISENKDIDVDTEVPSCPGCSRLTRVRDLDPSRDYSSNVYATPKPQAETIDFYRTALRRRGWEETDSSRTLSTIQPYVKYTGDQATLLQMTRNNEFLTVLGFPDENGDTTVHTVMGN